MRTHNNRSGLTMLEVMIAVAILGGLMAMISQSLRSGTQMSGMIRSTTDADNVAHRAVSTLIDELRAAKRFDGSASKGIAIANAGREVTFTICTGLDSSGRPVYGDERTWRLSNNQLLRVTATGTTVFASDLPTNTTLISYQPDKCYLVTLNTAYQDAMNNQRVRTTSGRVYLRSASLVPDGTYGEVVIGGVSTSGGTTGGTTTGGTTTGGTTTGGTTTGGTTTGGATTGGIPTPAVKVYPTLWISLVRSGNGSNQVLAGDVGATANGDTISSLVFTEDNVNWSNTNSPSGMNSNSAMMAVDMTSMNNKGVTVTLTATTASGGSTTVSKTATSNSGISY